MNLQSLARNIHLNSSGIWVCNDSEEMSYPEEGHDTCFSIEDNSFWFKHRNECISTAIKCFPPVEGGPIFDIGGGNGYVSKGLIENGFDVVLVEPGINGALNAKKRGIENVICATTFNAQFNNKTMSAIGLFDVVEHIKNDLAFLESLHPLLIDDGRLYITVPAYSFLWSQEDVSAGHYRRYTLIKLANTLTDAHFEIEFATYFFRFLPIPIALLRALPFRLGMASSSANKNSNKVSRDHAANHGLMNSFLSSILNSEVGNIRAKKQMRFGGSCLVVARRK